MNEQPKLSPLVDVLNAADQGGEFHVYAQHPSNDLLQRYVRGDVSIAKASSNYDQQGFSAGKMSEWGRVEVALHAKTCEQCWGTVTAMRVKQSQRVQQNQAVQTNRRSWVDSLKEFFELMVQPGPRMAISGAFVLVVGIFIGSALNSGTTLDQGELPPPTPSALSGAAMAPESLGPALSALGVQISDFAFDQPLIHYNVSQGETLLTIAENELGNAAHWIVIYLLNFEVLSDVSNANMPLTPALSLNLPATATNP